MQMLSVDNLGLHKLRTPVRRQSEMWEYDNVLQVFQLSSKSSDVQIPGARSDTLPITKNNIDVHPVTP